MPCYPKQLWIRGGGKSGIHLAAVSLFAGMTGKNRHFRDFSQQVLSGVVAVKSPPSNKCMCTAHCLSCDLPCISCWHFELIFAHLVFYFNLCGFWLPPSPSPFWVCMLVSIGSGEYFPLNFLQCDGASWRLHAGVVPARRVAMDTSLLCLRRSGSPPTFKAVSYTHLTLPTKRIV